MNASVPHENSGILNEKVQEIRWECERFLITLLWKTYRYGGILLLLCQMMLILESDFRFDSKVDTFGHAE